MATINGTPVNFGFASTANGITVTDFADAAITGLLIQSAEQSKAADSEVIRGGIGEEVSHAWHNQHDEATLEFVITGTAIGDYQTAASAIKNTLDALKAAGTLIKITACVSMPSLLGTTWEIQPGTKVTGSNTNAKRFSLPLKKFTGITATTSQ
jgi:hypothetical protein